MKKTTLTLRRLISLALSLTLTAALTLVPAQAAKTPFDPVKEITRTADLAALIGASAVLAAKAHNNLPNGTYIVSCKANDAMKLDMAGSYTGKATNVQLYQFTPANLTQQFRFTFNKEEDWYTASPMSDLQMAVNAYANKPAANTNVNVWPKDSKNSTQNWVLEQVEDGCYIIRLAYNQDLVLTAAGTKNQSNVKLAKYQAGNSKQLWRLTPLKKPGSEAAVISEATMKTLIKKVGVQKGNAAYTDRCAGVDVAYLYYWLKGKTTSVDASAQWNKIGGTSVCAKSKEDLYNKMKVHLANGGPCVLHVSGSAGQHWVVVRAFKDNTFYIADPWSGKLTTLDKSGYKLHKDLRVILCQGKAG